MILLFIPIILHVFLGTFVYFKNSKALPNKIFGLWMFVAVITSFSIFYQGIAKTAEAAAMANPVILSFSFIFSAFLVLLVSSIYYPRFINTQKYVFSFMIFTIIFSLLPCIDYIFRTNLITKGVVLNDSIYVIATGKLSHVVVLPFHIIEMILIIFMLAKGFRTSTRSERKQIVLIFIAYILTFSTLSIAHSLSDHIIRRFFVDFATLFLTSCFTYFIIKDKMFSPVEAGLEQAIRNMRDGLIVSDRNGKILKINQAAKNIFNFTKNTINKNMLDVFSYYPGLNGMIKAEEKDFDYIITPPSSVSSDSDFEKSRVVNISKTNILNEKAEFCGSLIIAKDITERKMFENKIKDANEFLENLFDTSPDGIIVSDMEGKILKANEVAGMIFGVEKEELIGKRPDGFAQKEDFSKKDRRDYRKEIFEKGKISNFEFTAMKMNGDRFPAEISTTILKDRNRGNIGAVSMLRDITERKRLEKEIEEEKNFLGKVIETSVDGIVITHKGGIIINANKAIKKLIECEDEKLVGEHIGILNPEGDHGRLIEQLYKTGYVSNHESKIKTKSGNYIPVEGSYSLLYDKNGEINGSVCMIRDIRQRKEFEAQIFQTNKLAAIGELASGVAHELNNPLAGILGYSQLINQKIEKRGIDNITKDDIFKITEYHKSIEKESNRCKIIVQNLLKFSRKSRVDFEPVDVNKVIDEAVAFTEHQLQLCNIKLIKTLGEGLPEICGNSAQLQQVFTNIIINAKKAMPEGGTLSVFSKYINGNGSGINMVEIEFSDTGHGIAPENLGKIFDPFFTTRKIGEGTGLGLSISYGIIKEHHGEINVNSEPHKGTTFTIYIPAEQKHVSHSAKHIAA